MPTDGERAAELLGDAIAEAVKRAVDEVGRAPLAEIGPDGGDGAATMAPPMTVVAPTQASEDPYEVLGVARTAPWEQIVAAHKRLARAWHPDLGGDDELFRRLNAAFAELRVRRGR